MNIIRMTGGLGNQMFGYALYLKFKSLGTECAFDDFSQYENYTGDIARRPLLLKKVFGIDYPVVTKEVYDEFTDSSMRLDKRLARKILGRRSRIYEEKAFLYDTEVLSKDNVYITGYFQSEKYFSDIKDEVIRSFSFTDEVKKEAEELIKKYDLGLSGDVGDSLLEKNSVSIHIRRGDYLDNPEAYGNICTDDYYKRAVRYIKERVDDPVFLLFSNDPEWTADWTSGIFEADDRYVVIRETTEETGYIDMYLMSRCAHNIIANSSFSWWGAYLNPTPKKIVIAPSKWVNDHETPDIYTSQMVRI
ncbi:MAG: alpha-1,2-fucosyltransferase [Lachnospiraceae bacterium]|nr:alpha-1,2-fucosyltransferase [Lachnospiraceae bacterium]